MPTLPFLWISITVKPFDPSGSVTSNRKSSYGGDEPGSVRPSDAPYATGVAGCVSTDAENLFGARTPFAEDPVREEIEPTGSVVHLGIAVCKVDASYGAIVVGDLLTTSPTPGHAMRTADPLAGTALGKAIDDLDSGTGLIRVLVMPR